MTAVVAAQWARTAARELDPGAALVGMSSDEHIDGTGRTFGWQLSYELPYRGTSLVVSIDLGLGHSRHEHHPPMYMTLEELPGQSDATVVPTPLPTHFRDSPAAVAELAAQGLDLGPNGTSASLRTRRLPDGSVVWAAEAGGQEYMAPFAQT